MCNCSWDHVCSRCRGTRHDPAYHDEQNDVLGFDPYNDQPEQERPACKAPVPEQERNSE